MIHLLDKSLDNTRLQDVFLVEVFGYSILLFRSYILLTRVFKICSAASLPLLAALSIVEGKPVFIQSPARKKFSIKVLHLGLVFNISLEGINVARFSFMIFIMFQIFVINLINF
jgi:hypothetical protein